MDKAKLTGSAAILLVSDVDISADYYRSKLGFESVRLYGDPHDFCILGRDGYFLMISKATAEDSVTPNWKLKDKTSNVYFWVDDAEKLYNEFMEREVEIDYTLHVTHYNIKEFGVSDPDGYDISFGEILK